MLKYKALQDTYLKKSIKPANQLGNGKKHLVAKGRVLKVDSIVKVPGYPNYAAVTLAYGAGEWLMFSDHFNTEGSGKKFPNGVPKPIVGTHPSKSDTVEAIVHYCKRVGVTRLDQVAYILSTAENEAMLKPIKEMRGRQLTRDQQRYWHTGFYGRGFIQVTWRSNYVKVGSKLGVDLISNPDLLLTYPIAIASLVLGMRDGWYTNARLNNYKRGDYWNMRNIVNPGEIKYRRYWGRAKKFVSGARKWEKYLNNFKATLYPWLT